MAIKVGRTDPHADGKLSTIDVVGAITASTSITAGTGLTVTSGGATINSGGMVLANNTALQIKNAAGTPIDMVKLDTAGQLSLGNSAQAAATYLTAGANQPVYLCPNGTAVHVVNQAGQVGIGTLSPSEKFTILDGNFLIQKTAYGGKYKWTAGTSSPDAGTVTWGDGTGWKMKFGVVGGTQTLTLVDNGQVGIGTTTPGATLDVNGQIAAALGSVSAPAFIPTGDTNTGMWFPAADTIAWSAGGSERLRMKSDGTLVVQANGADQMRLSYGTYGTINASNLKLMISDPGIGGWNRAAIGLEVYGHTDGWAGSSNLIRYIMDETSGALTTNNTFPVLYWGAAGTYSGRVGIGTYTPGYQLELSTNSAAKPTSNVWTVSSDARVKTDVTDWTTGLAVINGLRPIEYRLNGEYGTVDDGNRHVSVLAQEAMEVFPSIVGTYQWQDPDNEDAEPVELYNLNTNALQWALVNAIKELSAKVAVLEGAVA